MSFQSANDFVQASESYDQGYYMGVVTNNNDPLGIGRVQANVPGLYDTALGEVPWIGPLKDSPYGFGKSAKGPYGTYGAPPAGSPIKVELQGGDPHKPLYTNLYTQPVANPAFVSPNVWGYQDPDGNLMIYDMSTHTYKFVTAGGAVIVIDANGKRITQVNGDVETSNGDWTVNVTGNATITASSNISVQAGGTATYTAAGHVFHGPITADSTISAAADITDSTGSGNSQTMHNMRTVYDIHTHDGTDSHGDGFTTLPPNQQIP